MVCPNCQSEAISVIPAEVRLYRNPKRTMSHPPMTPAPNVRVCLDCGWSEFSIPGAWLSANLDAPPKAGATSREDTKASPTPSSEEPLELPPMTR
jgi:hypothetical protein